MTTPVGNTLQGVYLLADGVTHVVAINVAGQRWRQTSTSPITLTSSWQKVTTTTEATRGLRMSATWDAANFDIEWVCVTAGAAAPTATYGTPIFASDDFTGGLPIGDVYAKSTTGQKLIVNIGS